MISFWLHFLYPDKGVTTAASPPGNPDFISIKLLFKIVSYYLVRRDKNSPTDQVCAHARLVQVLARKNPQINSNKLVKIVYSGRINLILYFLKAVGQIARLSAFIIHHTIRIDLFHFRRHFLTTIVKSEFVINIARIKVWWNNSDKTRNSYAKVSCIVPKNIKHLLMNNIWTGWNIVNESTMVTSYLLTAWQNICPLCSKTIEKCSVI